jgi:hypothetical protein
MLYTKVIGVCSQIHTKHKMHCGQNTEFLNVILVRNVALKELILDKYFVITLIPFI